MRTITRGLVGLFTVLILSPSAVAASRDEKRPQIELRISMSRKVYKVRQPIDITLNLTNVGKRNLVLPLPDYGTDSLFGSQHDVQCLQLVTPGGRIICSNLQFDFPQAPSTVCDENGTVVLVAPVMVFNAGTSVTTTVSDLRQYYSLEETGTYTIKAVLDAAVYPRVIQSRTHPGKKLGNIREKEWVGVIESNTLKFEIQ